MAIIRDDSQLVVEPAAAATTAALLGPLRESLAGQRVGIICCGTNMAFDDYLEIMALGND